MGIARLSRSLDRITTVGFAVPWWLKGGISASNAKIAYAPKGAASLAASYINLANPGTNNAAPGVAPTWDATNGWMFNGSTQYLTTGFAPGNSTNWTGIIRFSNLTGTAVVDFFGTRATLRFHQEYSMSTHVLTFNMGGSVNTTLTFTSGVIAIAGGTGYKDGSSVGTFTPSSAGDWPAIYIGGYNFGGLARPLAGYVQAFAFYNTVLNGTQVSAVTTAMNAL